MGCGSSTAATVTPLAPAPAPTGKPELGFAPLAEESQTTNGTSASSGDALANASDELGGPPGPSDKKERRASDEYNADGPVPNSRPKKRRSFLEGMSDAAAEIKGAMHNMQRSRQRSINRRVSSDELAEAVLADNTRRNSVTKPERRVSEEFDPSLLRDADEAAPVSAPALAPAVAGE